MLFYQGKQLIEGIDSIDLALQPYITYYKFLDLNKQLDPKHGISLYPKLAKFKNSNGNSGYSYKKYYYLHISGEYINHDSSLKYTITSAIYELFEKKILCITDLLRSKIYNNVTKEFINKNLFLFISGIKVIEFCFDFRRNEISISEDAKIIDVSSSDFHKLLKDKLLKRTRCLIRDDTTYYSNDYKKSRKSTLKLYDRAIWLIKKGNEYPVKFINENPYKMRIEFVLKMNENTQFLTPSILNSNYNQLIVLFIPYLARLYRKYFLGKVLVNAHNHPYFYRIYDLAYSDTIRMNKSLEKDKPKKINDKNVLMNRTYLLAVKLLEEEDKRIENMFINPPDSYFCGLDNIDLLMENGVTPFDYQDPEKILLKDGEFVFFKSQGFFPKFKTLKEDD